MSSAGAASSGGVGGSAGGYTAQLLAIDHPLFTDAVQKALGWMRFLPAESGGRKVRQLVQMPFEFRIDR